MTDGEPPRTFKTAWFSKAARKALIADTELCDAMEQVRKGQADDLGGGVFKKRLDKNRHRSIIVAKGRRYWVYTYLFAKKDRDNITDAELTSFRDLADLYDRKTDAEIDLDLNAKELTEICHAREAQV
ncbi:Type II toxin-antitoxin system RelE/ParE family toxin [Sphingomonas antarctica]|uniref:type II toxin-antitoxin system RelE/ParE family toxin n=1 Tax=Sphingomonas antarctica TaxID=2040274 RepID=UPI0027BE0068|nr:type II toxin-antitoxin system RelE/ParE family toxin [Pseudomonadota bacterium]